MSMRISTAQLSQRLVADISKKQSDVADIQTQIASGKRINSPSDDPAQAGRLLRLEEASSQLVQYNRNASAAETRLTLEETTLTGVNDTLMRVRDLALSSTSGAVDDQSRTAIRAEVEQLLEELYDLGNLKDSNGDFLFSGNNNASKPFSQQNPVSYAGNDMTRSLPIGLGREIKTGDTGSDVFIRIKEGNGGFSVAADAANAGTGVIATGSVNDPAAYDRGNYKIVFTAPDTYDVIDTSGGAPIQSGVAFTENTAIDFKGISTSIQGVPQVGDSFEISPSGFKDLFSTVDDLITALAAPTGSVSEKASQQQNVDGVLVNIDQALEHINTFRSRIGSRVNSIDNSREQNSAVQLEINRTQAGMEDLDYTKAVTDLQSRINSLEVLQKSFARIENLSLFNYL